MTLREIWSRPESWRRWYLRALPAYWVFLFLCTHFPQLRIPGAIPESDKLAHFIAYALLTFLFWRFCEALRRPLPHWFSLVALGVLLAYAAVDESTQLLVGRSASVFDFLADACGVLAALGLLEWRRTVVESRAAPAT